MLTTEQVLVRLQQSKPDKQWTISEIANLIGIGRKTVDYQMRHNMESHTEQTLTGEIWVVETHYLIQWAKDYLPAILNRQLRKQQSNA